MDLCNDIYDTYAYRLALEESIKQDVDSAGNEPSDNHGAEDGKADNGNDDDEDEDDAEMDELNLLVSERDLNLDALRQQRESDTETQAAPQAGAAVNQVGVAAAMLDVTLDALEQRIAGRIQQLRIEDSGYWRARFEWGQEDSIVQAIRRVRTLECAFEL
jgi:hypothetical protein